MKSYASRAGRYREMLGRSWVRTAIAMSVVLVASQAAWAHVDPVGSSGTGITVTMTVFRNDGITPVLTSGSPIGTVSPCETIQYRATLQFAGAPNGAFEGGTWNITLPNGTPVDVTPAGGVPCIGGTTDDPNSVANNGRGLCDGAPPSLNSVLVPYTVTAADIVANTIVASVAYASAFAHISVTDTFGVGGGTPLPIGVTPCPADEECRDSVCDPALASNGRLGLCTFVNTDGDPCTSVTPGECEKAECLGGVCAALPDPTLNSNTCGTDTPGDCVHPGCEDGTCAPAHTTDPNDTPCTTVTPDQCEEAVCISGVCTSQPDPDQVGTPCTGPDPVDCQSPVCQADGSCANQADPSKDSDPCGTDTSGDCVHPGCESGSCVTAHTTDPDSTPCSDTDGDLCTHAGCEMGSCVQTHMEEECTDPTCEVCDPTLGECVGRDPLPTECAPAGCRITAGGVTPDGNMDLTEMADLRKATFGGQVGAPCGCIDCFDEADHIQGNWTHVRHRRRGRLHAMDYYSLVCGCDGDLSGELCGDREVGPLPRKAPANTACFTGVGEFRNDTVAFRVEVEDRGEPGSTADPNDIDDVYRIRIWIPDGESIASLLDAICCTIPDGQLDVRQPDVDDGGNIVHGNIQIHPQIPSHIDECPVPGGSCVP